MSIELEERLKPRRRWGQRVRRRLIMFSMISMAILFLVPFISRAWHIAQVPDLPELCDPFEYDSPSVVEELNARHYFQQAVVEFANFQKQHLEFSDDEQERQSADVMLDEEFKEFVSKSPPFVITWQLGCDCYEFELLFREDAFHYEFKDTLDGFQNLAAYFLRLGRKHLTRDETMAAFVHFRDVFRAGLLMQQNGEERQLEYGMRIANSALYQGFYRWALHPDVVEDDLLAARELLDADLQELRRPISETILREYARWMRMVQSKGQSQLRESLFSGNDSDQFSLHQDLYLYALGEPARFQRILKQVAYNALSQCDMIACQRDSYQGQDYRLFNTSIESPENALSAPRLDQALTREFNPNGVNLYHVINTSDRFEIRLRIFDQLLLREIHYRRHLAYPSSLEEMDDDLVEALPVDPFNNERFHDRIEPDGSLFIYSVGFNKIDDGGQIEEGHDLGLRIPVSDN